MSSFNGHQMLNMCFSISFQSKVEVFEGHAKFDENGVCHVGDHQIAGDHTLIATGGHPIVPDLPGEIVICFLPCRLVLVILVFSFNPICNGEGQNCTHRTSIAILQKLSFTFNSFNLILHSTSIYCGPFVIQIETNFVKLCFSYFQVKNMA